MVIYSGLSQNVSGVDSNIGFFFGGFNGLLNNVQVGWYAQNHTSGDNLVDGLVTEIDTINQVITISLPNKFKSGKSYIFTSEPLTIPISNTCFPIGTPIRTNQGIIDIDKINPIIHTIRNKKIVCITETTCIDKYLVCFEKDSLGEGLPSEKTIISKNHIIFFKGNPVNAKYFIDKFENVTKIEYSGEKLYNILLEDYDKMIVNNLIVETLNPDNFIAKLYSNIYSIEQRNELIIKINKKTQDNIDYYNSLYG